MSLNYDARFQRAKECLRKAGVMKGHFPFRLGTTSYIYPGEILPNVELLSDFVDEIQLLLFESKSHSNLPGGKVGEKLIRIAEEKLLQYTIHLPLDAYPGDPDEQIRKESVSNIQKIYAIGRRIGCERFVFHYAPRGIENRALWRDQLLRSTNELLDSGIKPSFLCVENVNYPFSFVQDLVEEFRLSVCIDVGHLRVHGHSLKDHLDTWMDRTKVIHLHGLKNGKDHHGLSSGDSRCVRRLLTKMEEVSYRETLILEVFQLEHLLESLITFQKLWNNQN